MHLPIRRVILALSIALSFPPGAIAQSSLARTVVPEAIRFHLASWHDRPGYDNANFGGALRWRGGLVAGGFNNSLGRTSWYGGVVVPAFEAHAIQLELMAGVITGYSDVAPVDVVAVPSL